MNPQHCTSLSVEGCKVFFEIASSSLFPGISLQVKPNVTGVYLYDNYGFLKFSMECNDKQSSFVLKDDNNNDRVSIFLDGEEVSVVVLDEEGKVIGKIEDK